MLKLFGIVEFSFAGDQNAGCILTSWLLVGFIIFSAAPSDALSVLEATLYKALLLNGREDLYFIR